MTKTEALAMLDMAPTGDHPSQINPSLTCDQAIAILRRAIDGGVLDGHKPKTAAAVIRNVLKVAQWS